MNWITNFVRPKVKSLWSGSKPDTPDNLWRKCPSCNGMIFHRDLEAAQYVCMHCDHHLKINASQRMKYLFDDAAWDTIALPDVPIDPLKFKDEKRYADRLREARSKTGQQDALQAARGNVAGVRTTVAVQSFDFMGGSLGMAVGEGLVASMRAALDHRTPYVLFTASGGARMQEGILSLMQMPRVTIAIQMLREAGLPYVVVHTDPTTGGVTASYAMLGDVHVSEPGALIGFAGPRVIENTIREKLPEGFQRAEYLLDHGMVDMVVHRHKMRENLGRLLKLLTRKTTRASSARTGYETGPYAVPMLQAAQPTPFERPTQPSV
ncbi:MAG: acetyl-CoA carboxylase, carboxyltransferase subunit beta [Alphaproteobacteria bacterium]|nr:acetyl-CoA carboxylase, carboxyltransferase subunit beta [Alphaproteobacteria bacterium]